jgi:multiple sugar transport system substrate-binding protein
MAAVPSYQGEVTAALHSDNFLIMKSTKHPEEAFEVLTYLVGEAAPDLLLVYGAMPARMSLQDGFFVGLDEKFPQGVDWQVAVDSLSYPDNPSHEAYMPNFSKADDRVKAFQSLYNSTAGLDLDAEIDTLVSDLQAIFEESE